MTNNPLIGSERLSLEPRDSPMISLMRVLLAGSALVVVGLDPLQPERLVAVTQAAMAAYVAYSAVLLVLAIKRIDPAITRHTQWADVAWYLFFIALSGGATSVFFLFFFFSILVASFRGGYAHGLRITLVSAVLFAVVGYASAVVTGSAFELHKLLLRLVYMLGLGYMMAYWGGAELTLRTRLALFQEIIAISNPRFGVDHTIGFVMEKIRASFGADSCLMVHVNSGHAEYSVRRADRHNPDKAVNVELVSPGLASRLLVWPASHAVVFTRSRWWGSRRPAVFGYDVETKQRQSIDRVVAAELAGFLDAQSFLSVPVRCDQEITERLFLTSRRARAFQNSDVEFIIHALKQIIPLVEKIQLVDQLASLAAEGERQKIARDIHDSVIQPYIGLQIGLSAVRKKIGEGVDAVSDIDRLIQLSASEVNSMRGYMSGLRAAQPRADNLFPAVNRFVAKFNEATNINVQVRGNGELHLSDRLAAEVFQMIAEGLSNIRRHTLSKYASISIGVADSRFHLMIENDGWDGAHPEPFVPHSISERARAIGGESEVHQHADGGTTLKVSIPL